MSIDKNESLREIAKYHDIDWSKISQFLDENESLRALFEAQQKIINDQGIIIRTYQNIPGLNLLYRIKKRLIEIFSPRLGNLNQYAPRAQTKLGLFHAKLTQSPLTISVVTPSFNQGHFIEKTIRSVLDQDYTNLEYFIQDGSSTDHSIEIIKRYQENLTGWVSIPDNGQTQAINLGFAKTQGEIMAYLNSDDLLLPGALACVADYFHLHPHIDVVYGNRLLIDEEGQEIGRWILPGHDSKVLSWADYIPQETLFWRRRIWDKVGGKLDESFRFAMDWDLLVRFKEAGAQFAHIPFFLGAFRIHEKQKTSSVIKQIGLKEMARIRKRMLGYTPTPKEIRKAIFWFMLQHLVVDIMYRIKSRSPWFKNF